MGERSNNAPIDPQVALREHILAELKRRGWKASDLAAQTNISPAKLSRFFNDKGAEISIDDLYKIAEGFGGLPGDFLPNSSGTNHQVARVLERLGAFTAPEQFHLIQALDSLIDLRTATIDNARVLYGGVGIRGRVPSNDTRPNNRP